MNNSRKVIIGVLLILTLVLAGVAAFVAINLGEDPDDVSVGAGYCPPITCADGAQFGEDPNTPHDTCAARAAEACASHGGVAGGGGGGGTTNTCSGANNNNACQNVGQVVAIGSGTCVCTRTSGTACGCVPTSGTSCNITVNNTGGSTCSAVGGACTKSDGRAGTCVSAGISGGQLTCGCQVDPNQQGGGIGAQCSGPSDCLSTLICNTSTVPGTCQQPTTQPQPECTRTSDCASGQYCNIAGGGTCFSKIGTGQACRPAGDVKNGTQSESCLSGVCTTSASDPNGTCTVPGTGANACSANNPCQSGQYCHPTSFTCQSLGGVGADCTSDSACQSGLACLSLRCRQPVDDSGAATGGACTSGQWYCGSSFGCAAGSGKLCSNGTITGASCTVADACASQVSGQLQTGMSCAGLTRLSAGEQSNGSFVGCSGRLNCFCPGQISVGASYPAGTTDTVNCIADVGNDSCGAGSSTPITNPPGGGGGGGGTTNPPPQQTVEPYCGDAICQTGELCERTTPGASSYLSCSTQTPVAECRGIGTAAPTPAGSCNYCGDGIVNGPEQCDYNAPGTTDCNTSCQNVVAACVALTENGPDPIRSGAGNVIEYTLVYTNANTGNPYPNIRLRVGPEGTPVGRDANATAQTTVAPFATPSASDTGSTKIYKFLWEAASTGGAAVADGTYDVRVLLNGLDSSVITSTSCQESITVAASAAQAPLFTITKSSAEVCLANGDAQIDYTVNVTNNGPISSEIDQVQDTLDADIVAAGITPTNIIPSYGTYSNGVITWSGTVEDRTYTAGQTKQFTYTLVIPEVQLVNFHNAGVDNTVTVDYGDNTSTFEVNTPITCSLPTVPTYIPTTSFGSDSSRYIVFGAMFIVMGVLVYKYNAHLLMLNTLGSFGLLRNVRFTGLSNDRASNRYEKGVMKRVGKSK